MHWRAIMILGGLVFLVGFAAAKGQFDVALALLAILGFAVVVGTLIGRSIDRLVGRTGRRPAVPPTTPGAPETPAKERLI